MNRPSADERLFAGKIKERGISWEEFIVFYSQLSAQIGWCGDIYTWSGKALVKKKMKLPLLH